MVFLEVIGVILLVGIAVAFFKLLIAGAFVAGEKVVDKLNSSRPSNLPYWEQHFIIPYADLISSLNQAQKTALYLKMVEVAIIDGDLTEFESLYLKSFKRAFELADTEVVSLYKSNFLGLGPEQVTLIYNGVISSSLIHQKEWFLLVLDKMMSHGGRVPTIAEITQVLTLAEDIGIPYSRVKDILGNSSTALR